jgi:nucleoside-diphosphate-sugar epimerase
MTSATPKTVAVTGATGYVGSVIVRALADHGLTPLRLVRSPSGADRRYDLSDRPSADLLDGVGALVHCAWDLRLTSREDIWAVNVAGSRRLLGLAAKQGVRTIFVSSMSAYDGTRQLYGSSKLDVERDALRLGHGVVRLGLVYGPGWGGMAGSLRKLTALPVTPLVSRRSHQFTAHEADVGAGIVRLLDADPLPGVPLGFAHPNPVRFVDLLRAFAAADGQQSRLVPVPWQAVYAGLRTAELARLSLPLRADSMLGLARPAPAVPNSDVVAGLGITMRAFDLAAAPTA